MYVTYLYTSEMYVENFTFPISSYSFPDNPSTDPITYITDPDQHFTIIITLYIKAT
jgi:hypothetical protein